MEPTWTSECGRIQLYHGDCREIIPHVKADSVITDPPYGIGALMKGGKNTGHWNTLSGGNEWDMELPDLAPLLNLGVITVIWGGNYFPLPPARCVLAWHKLNAVPTQADFELAWTNADRPAKMISTVSGGAMKRDGHPTQKPIAVMKWCMDVAKVPHDAVVFDPYIGSGTTAIACIRTGRRFIGCEIDYDYFDIAKQRIVRELQQPYMPGLSPAKMEQGVML